MANEKELDVAAQFFTSKICSLRIATGFTFVSALCAHIPSELPKSNGDLPWS